MKIPPVPNHSDFYKELLDHIGDGVYFVDRERRFLYWNEGATRLTGYKAEEILGKRCQDDILCHTDHSGKRLCNDGCPLTASIADGAFHQANVLLRHKKGRQVPVSVRVQPMRAADGTVIGAIEIFSDNSAEIEALRKTKAMNRMAFLDHLTQLPNRRFLQMSLQTALTEFRVHKESVGVLVIDLDMFKGINDSYGHSCGDRALQEVAKRSCGVASSHGHHRALGRRRVSGHRPECGPRGFEQPGAEVRRHGGANLDPQQRDRRIPPCPSQWAPSLAAPAKRPRRLTAIGQIS